MTLNSRKLEALAAITEEDFKEASEQSKNSNQSWHSKVNHQVSGCEPKSLTFLKVKYLIQTHLDEIETDRLLS